MMSPRPLTLHRTLYDDYLSYFNFPRTKLLLNIIHMQYRVHQTLGMSSPDLLEDIWRPAEEEGQDLDQRHPVAFCL